jgi:hypothetical protein
MKQECKYCTLGASEKVGGECVGGDGGRGERAESREQRAESREQSAERREHRA